MPGVSYYLGRPARFWIAVMSGAARPTVANPAAATSLGGAQRAAPATRRRAPEEPNAQAAAAASISALETRGSSTLAGDAGAAEVLPQDARMELDEHGRGQEA